MSSGVGAMRSLTRRSSERAPDKPTGWKEASVHWSGHCPESMFEKLQGSFQDRLNRHFVGATVGAMPRQKKRLSEVKWQVWVVCDRLNPPMWPVEPTLRAVSAQRLVTALLSWRAIYMPHPDHLKLVGFPRHHIHTQEHLQTIQELIYQIFSS